VLIYLFDHGFPLSGHALSIEKKIETERERNGKIEKQLFLTEQFVCFFTDPKFLA